MSTAAHVRYAKLFFLLFVWGPALVGYACGWLVHHPTDWTGPAVVAPVGLGLTFVSFRWGLRRLRRDDDARLSILAGMVAGGLLGLALFGMLALRVLD